jgi:nicotinamidase-related amidase
LSVCRACIRSARSSAALPGWRALSANAACRSFWSTWPAARPEVQFNFTPPADWTDLVAELDCQPGDYTVTKQQIGAFYGTALEQILRRRGVTQVVLAGVSTSSGVEATARNAYDHGYNVTLAVDAMTDLTADAHRHSVETIFPKLGETATTDDVLKLLAERPQVMARDQAPSRPVSTPAQQ